MAGFTAVQAAFFSQNRMIGECFLYGVNDNFFRFRIGLCYKINAPFFIDSGYPAVMRSKDPSGFISSCDTDSFYKFQIHKKYTFIFIFSSMSTPNYLGWKNIDLQQLARLNFGDLAGHAQWAKASRRSCLGVLQDAFN
jgi:hypothetical protein